MSTNCGGCDATWTGTSICHCANCHRTFSGLGHFDAHRSQYGERGSCIDPATLTAQGGKRIGEPLMFFREGMWRGPETDADGLAALKALRRSKDTAA